jgi:large subunit ribosomal protein L17
MRHRIAHRKLGRVTEHRIALLRNQADALLRHERIRTTVAKAKELRPFVERLITVAKRSLADGADSGRTVHARRIVRRDLADREVAAKLFETIAPRFASRPGGYIRILRLGQRQGDAAEMAQVELIGSEYEPEADRPDASESGGESAGAGGVGGRIRRAARRMRGRTDDDRKGAVAGGKAASRGARAAPKRTRKKV